MVKEKANKRKSIGEQYRENVKGSSDIVDVAEVREQFLKDYRKNLEEAALAGKKRFSEQGYTGNIYLVVLLRREKILKKMYRNGFLSRITCPTPNYDQTVYIYNPKTDEISFLWVIPSPEETNFLYKNRHSIEVMGNELMPYVIDFVEGRLYLKMKELNGESKDPGYKLENKDIQLGK